MATSFGVKMNARRLPIATILTLLFKSASILKIAKPALTFGTMSLSMFAYAFWLGPWFAVGFIAMLFIHEMGHVIALRLKGYPAPTMVFIPFLGAAIFSPANMDRDQEAFIGYGGPLLGSVGALLLFSAYFLIPKSTAADLVLITSYAAIILNLFNMIPITPLDGGRITQAVGRWFKWVGLGALAILTAILAEPAMLLVWILCASDFRMRPKTRSALCTTCATAMTALMVLGYSSQPWWINLIDIIVAWAYTWFVAQIARKTPDTISEDIRPDLDGERKALWFVLYAALALALIAVCMFQTTLLPERPA